MAESNEFQKGVERESRSFCVQDDYQQLDIEGNDR